jgi:hypothetical protein
LALRDVGPESEAESVRFRVSSDDNGIRNAKFQRIATCCHRRGSSRLIETRNAGSVAVIETPREEAGVVNCLLRHRKQKLNLALAIALQPEVRPQQLAKR